MRNFPMKEKLRQYIYIETFAEIALIGLPDGNVQTSGGITNLDRGKTTPAIGLNAE